MLNTVTLILFLSFWPIWLAWEIYLLVKRGHDSNIKTISMVARDRGWQFSSVVYTWCGLASHFWWNWRPATLWGTLCFWATTALLLASDVVSLITWPANSSPTIRPWYHNPLIWGVVGILAGHFLFPQPV